MCRRFSRPRNAFSHVHAYNVLPSTTVHVHYLPLIGRTAKRGPSLVAGAPYAGTGDHGDVEELLTVDRLRELLLDGRSFATCSPVARSSTRARSAKAVAPIVSNMVCAVRSCWRAWVRCFSTARRASSSRR